MADLQKIELEQSRPLHRTQEQKGEQPKPEEVTLPGDTITTEQNSIQEVPVTSGSTEPSPQEAIVPEVSSEVKPQEARVTEQTVEKRPHEIERLGQKQENSIEEEVTVVQLENKEQTTLHEAIVNEDNIDQPIPQAQQNIEQQNNLTTTFTEEKIEPPKAQGDMQLENAPEPAILQDIPVQLAPQAEEHLAKTQGKTINADLKRKLEEISSADYSHYKSYTAEDHNQIWAGALTLAWKELLEKHIDNKPLILSEHQDTANNFNQCHFKKEQIDQKSTFIKSGYGQQTVTQINAGMAEKFPDCSFSPLSAQLGPQDLIAYAYLFKKLLFDVQFQKHEYNRLTFTGRDNPQKLVPSFYVDNSKQARQIQIQRWIDNEDFIVSLKNSSPTDKIYLYKPPIGKELSVGQAIQEIVYTEKLNENLSQLQEFRHDIDKFEMPILDLNYKHSHSELTGLAIQNDCHLKGFRFLEVAEGLKLKIDEKGVRCESYGFMIVNECSISGPNPKTLHFDRPFWIVMKERNRHPYLCVHINNI